MKTGSTERFMRLWATELERGLSLYIEAVGPYCTYDDLLQLCRSYPRPMLANFSSKHKRDVFYGTIIRQVVQRSFESERNSQVLDRNDACAPARPPFNAEFALYLVLPREERDDIVGDLIEAYGKVLKRFDKRRADVWFYKQVAGSVLPLLRRQILRVGALVWIGRILRRLIS